MRSCLEAITTREFEHQEHVPRNIKSALRSEVDRIALQGFIAEPITSASEWTAVERSGRYERMTLSMIGASDCNVRAVVVSAWK